MPSAFRDAQASPLRGSVHALQADDVGNNVFDFGCGQRYARHCRMGDDDAPGDLLGCGTRAVRNRGKPGHVALQRSGRIALDGVAIGAKRAKARDRAGDCPAGSAPGRDPRLQTKGQRPPLQLLFWSLTRALWLRT